MSVSPMGFFARITTRALGLSIALDERDSPTHAHCNRVSGLSFELGVACGLSERELGQLRLAAGFHDVGKIGIPDAVLKKPGTFDAADWAIMKTHPIRSERIVLALGLDDGPAIATAVRQHHERFDGMGYPDGIAGESIDVMARMVAIADAYDAMARFRLPATPRTHVDIIRELHQEAGRHHDPFLVKKFAELIERSPFKASS